MEVILLADVKSLGKKGDRVTVSDGYARNCLLKKNLGVEATAANVNDLKLQKKHEDKVAQQKYEDALALAESLKDKPVTVSIKCGEQGRVFGSVSGKEIAAAVTKQLGLEIDKKKLVLPEPIRSVGTTLVTVKIHPKVTGQLTVKVVEEH